MKQTIIIVGCTIVVIAAASVLIIMLLFKPNSLIAGEWCSTPNYMGQVLHLNELRTGEVTGEGYWYTDIGPPFSSPLSARGRIEGSNVVLLLTFGYSSEDGIRLQTNWYVLADDSQYGTILSNKHSYYTMLKREHCAEFYDKLEKQEEEWASKSQPQLPSPE